jgi:hypothetical protein
MNVMQHTVKNLVLSSWISNSQPKESPVSQATFAKPKRPKIDLFSPLRNWLDNIEVKNPTFAHRLCKSIPNQCPFERQIELFGHTILSIPPMCKLNPLYNEVIGLRFRAICYLADVCGEDVSSYC